MLLWALPAASETIRIATYNAELEREGPGLLLRDILDPDEQVRAVVEVITSVNPDILLLLGFDYDFDGRALSEFARLTGYAHSFATPPNTGVPTGFDIDQNGRLNEPRDAQGYGRFRGEGGMAVLSRYPIDADRVLDLSHMLWKDLPHHQIPDDYFPQEVLDVQRLSSVAHWDVPIRIGADEIHLLGWHATPPVFDGVEDRNGRRNHDETAIWLHYLNGALDWPAPESPFVILGGANLDLFDGDGRGEALKTLIADPRVIDPEPKRPAGHSEDDDGHRGDPLLDTAVFDGRGPGNLRVDYVLPSQDLSIIDSGIYWPLGDETVATASRHRLVWVDVAF